MLRTQIAWRVFVSVHLVLTYPHRNRWLTIEFGRPEMSRIEVTN